MLNVLAAIQFRSRGEWRNLPYFAISQAFRNREVQKDCQNRMAKTDLTFPVFSLKFVDLQFSSAFTVSFHYRRSDCRVKFDSGVISLDQSQFFATHSNQ